MWSPRSSKLVKLESLFAHRIFLHVDLQPLPTLLQMGESRLAHQPDRHDAPGDAHGHAILSSCFAGLSRVIGQNLRNRVGVFVAVRIRLLSESFNLLQFLAPQFVDFFVECQRIPLLISVAAKIPTGELRRQNGKQRL